MRIRSKSAFIYNVICEGNVIKTFRYKKAAERWVAQMTIPAEIEEIPVDTNSAYPTYNPPATPRGWDTAGA
jgi:hypothetical protein